jgi:hypothetical protein
MPIIIFTCGPGLTGNCLADLSFRWTSRQWLLATAYNTGTECLQFVQILCQRWRITDCKTIFRSCLFDEAKRWFEASTVICRFVPGGKEQASKVCSHIYIHICFSELDRKHTSFFEDFGNLYDSVVSLPIQNLRLGHIRTTVILTGASLSLYAVGLFASSLSGVYCAILCLYLPNCDLGSLALFWLIIYLPPVTKCNFMVITRFDSGYLHCPLLLTRSFWILTRPARGLSLMVLSPVSFWSAMFSVINFELFLRRSSWKM